jgi:hypothetical protein
MRWSLRDAAVRLLGMRVAFPKWSVADPLRREGGFVSPARQVHLFTH